MSIVGFEDLEEDAYDHFEALTIAGKRYEEAIKIANDFLENMRAFPGKLEWENFINASWAIGDASATIKILSAEKNCGDADNGSNFDLVSTYVDTLIVARSKYEEALEEAKYWIGEAQGSFFRTIFPRVSELEDVKVAFCLVGEASAEFHHLYVERFTSAKDKTPSIPEGYFEFQEIMNINWWSENVSKNPVHCEDLRNAAKVYDSMRLLKLKEENPE